MKKAAMIISIIFQPIFMPLYAYLLYAQTLFSKTILSSPFYWKSILLIFLFSCAIPMLGIGLYLRFQHKSSDIFIQNRKDRTIPYLLCLISYFMMIVTLLKVDLLYPFALALSGAFVALLLVFAINFKWKISAHMTGLGAVLGIVIVYAYMWGENPYLWIFLLFFISGIVGSSRIYLKSHTLSQVGAGFFLGMCCEIITLMMFFIFGFTGKYM